MTFWARFYGSRNDLGKQVKVKYILTLRPVPGTEFRGGSCSGSQISWGPHIGKVLPGYIKRRSKTPITYIEHVGFSRTHFLRKFLPIGKGPGPGPYGPGPIWAQVHMGPGPYGPWPIWNLAHMGPGTYTIIYTNLL